ncbi:MAG: hypothetical protein R3301_07285 [Saprospiraceae bacterium]|nr:hypothetical protein [Saprospiraceae bacterium]
MQNNHASFRQCAMTNNDCRLLISREMDAPSFSRVSELVRRAFNRNLTPATARHHNGESGTINTLDIRYEECSVHMRMLVCASLEEHKEQLAEATSRIKPGDIVILESLDLSEGNCFPYHSAFGRFQEILSRYQEAIGHPTTNEDLNALTRTEMSVSAALMKAPVRLRGSQKTLPSRILESIRPCVRLMDMISDEEFDTVTAELSRIGRNQEVSMSSFTVNRMFFTI